MYATGMTMHIKCIFRSYLNNIKKFFWVTTKKNFEKIQYLSTRLSLRRGGETCVSMTSRAKLAGAELQAGLLMPESFALG